MEPACLGDETIAALLEGRLAGAHGDATRAHLAGCADCRQLVSATVAALPVASTVTPVARGSSPASGASQTLTLAPGAVLAGKYRIERALGEGGMGRVMVARQLGLDRLVAIKLLHPDLASDPLALQRFGREARLVAALHSEHVVRVHDFGEGPGGQPYLVMELLEGEDLAAVVARGPVEPLRALSWLRAATEAVAEAHALGMVHRDLKPSNLFLTRAGRIKVLDFGLAKLVPTADVPTLGGARRGDGGVMTHTGVILGSPHYMAPEQILGARQVDARADLWSLGATLFHLLRGFPPFSQSTLDSVFASILSGWQPPLDGVAPPLAAIIRRALARDPAARFASATELLYALDAAAAELARAAQPPAPMARPHSNRGLALGGIGLVVAVAVATIAWWPQPPPTTPTRTETAATPTREVAPAPAPAERSPAPAPPPWRREAPPVMDLPMREFPRRAAARPSTAPADSTPAPAPTEAAPAPETTPGSAPSLDTLDEARLQQRLASLGWRTTSTAHDSFPGCEHTRLMVTKKGAPGADVFLLDCASAAMAASELARLRRGFPQAWFSLDGARLLMVAREEERLSRALAEALQEP